MTTTTNTVPSLRFPEFEEEWDAQSIGAGYRLQGGYAFKSSEFSDSGIPVIRISNVTANGIDLSGVKHHPVIPKEDAFVIQEGDLLIAMSGATTGKTCVYDLSRKAYLNQRVGLFRKTNKDHATGFLTAFVASRQFADSLSSLLVAGAQPNIGSRDIESIPFTFPTLPEQRKIAEFLTAVDGRIGQLSQKKALLEDYKKGVMQQLFTQALRFKDDHGNEFPEWEEAEFGKIAKRSSEKHNPMTSATEYPSVELESLSQGTGQLLQLFVSSDQKSIKSKFTKGDVLFGKLRPYLRKWLMPAFDGVCSSEIWVLRGKTVTNAYLYHLIQTGEFMKATNVSSGSKMPRADWDHIAAVTFSYPASTDEQSKIANFLTALDRKIESVAQQITHTQAFKKGLLQQMFV